MARLISTHRRENPQDAGPGRSPCRPHPIGRVAASAVGALVVALAGCRQGPSPEAQRIDQLNLKIQQLEQRLNKLASERHDGSDPRGKPPVGAIKSLTVRTGTEDDRLRIYWADGQTTDLPCTKEQTTFVCG